MLETLYINQYINGIEKRDTGEKCYGLKIFEIYQTNAVCEPFLDAEINNTEYKTIIRKLEKFQHWLGIRITWYIELLLLLLRVASFKKGLYQF